MEKRVIVVSYSKLYNWHKLIINCTALINSTEGCFFGLMKWSVVKELLRASLEELARV